MALYTEQFRKPQSIEQVKTTTTVAPTAQVEPPKDVPRQGEDVTGLAGKTYQVAPPGGPRLDVIRYPGSAPKLPEPTREPSAVVTTDKAKDEVAKMEAAIMETKKEPEITTEVKDVAAPPSSQPDIPTGYYESSLSNLDELYQGFLDVLEERKENLDIRQQKKIDEIHALYERKRDEMKQANANRLAGLEILGARSGRQRYAPEMQSQIIGAEEKAGLKRITDLETEELSLINSVEAAIEDKQFQLAAKQFDLVLDLRNKKEAEIDKMYERAYTEELRATQLEDRALDKINSLVDLGINPNDLSKEEVSKLEREAALPEGTLNTLYEVNQADLEIANVEKQLDYQKKIVDLLSKVPEGEMIPIGDDLVSGWKKEKPDVWTSTAVDNQGNMSLISYDRNTGASNVIPLGNIGKKEDKIIKEVNGTYYSIDKETGMADPVMTTGDRVNPATFSGFDEWKNMMGQTTVEFGGSTRFESFHPGWDIAGKKGDRITAFLPNNIDGIVTKINDVDDNAYGKYIEITDEEGRMWRYSHLDKIGVQPGQEITMGDTVGTMGNTGQVYSVTGGDGTHLDLRVFATGDPLQKPLEEEIIDEKEAAIDMTAQMATVVGDDGFVSPDDYLKARNAWIAAGFNPTIFDTKMRGFRNPNNPNYVISKEEKDMVTILMGNNQSKLIEEMLAE